MKRYTLEEIKEVKEELIDYLISYFVNDYKYNEDEAKKLVMSSALLELMDEETTWFVMHYNIEHWVKWIIEENKNKSKNKTAIK